MTQGIGDAVAKFTSEVDEAVSRARRAAAEAREQATRLRAENQSSADRVRSGELRLDPDEVTDPELRRSAARFRDEQGLPVEEFPADAELVNPPKRRPVAPSADDDEDFSQEQIMTRF
jgi:hypothetical protein